jgi:hypothetical protein
VLAAGDIPNLGGLQVFHIFRDSVRRMGISLRFQKEKRKAINLAIRSPM